MDPIQPVVQVVAEDLVLVDWGPMTLTVSVWRKGQARPVIAAKVSRAALFHLQTLSAFQGYLKRNVSVLPIDRPLPSVVERAFVAVRSISEDLTPLAAVAGAVADEVAARAIDLGADRVIVNNGGDIAVRVNTGERVVVGLKLPGSDNLFGQLHVEGGSGIGGVASSGWAGRSHSPGVADMVTVWGCSAGLADAAATFIAGKTVVYSKNIQQTRACELDSLSDLGDTFVTETVGRLTSAKRLEALDQGVSAAERIYEKGLLRGYMLHVQGETILMDPDAMMKISD